MRTIEHVGEMQVWSEDHRRRGRSLVLVPTMGSLHEGHLSLVREGRKRGDLLVVSIFVNPTQFGLEEDFGSYPRCLGRDRRLLGKEKVDVIFHPSVEEIYPEGNETPVKVGRLGGLLCGASRPDHFPGVATVVAKLFNMVRPHSAVFGLKDYQQVLVVRRMVSDLKLNVEIVACPTVRERDGLAVSSRNDYLSSAERKAALCLHRALTKAEELVRCGVKDKGRIVGEAMVEISREPLVQLDYFELCDPESLESVDKVQSKVLLALAAWVGKARLIDNTILQG